MDFNKDYLKIVKKLVKDRRYNHILGVVDEAMALANKYNISVDKARIAASLHDITKNMDIDFQVELITKTLGPDALKDVPFGAIHAISGAIYSRDYLGVDDEDIYNSIYYHTLGRPKMSTLEKIIYISDFIEPSRNSEASIKCKEIAYKNLDEGLLYAMEYIVKILEAENKFIPSQTYESIKYYKELINE